MDLSEVPGGRPVDPAAVPVCSASSCSTCSAMATDLGVRRLPVPLLFRHRVRNAALGAEAIEPLPLVSSLSRTGGTSMRSLARRKPETNPPPSPDPQRVRACGQRPLSLVVTAGQRGDSPRFGAVLGGSGAAGGPGRPRTRPSRVLADKADSSRANRAYLRRRGIVCTIPEKDDQAAHRRAKASGAAAHQRSTGWPTGCGMRWSAGSTGSSGTGGGHPV
jgi:hypothetical protein